MSRCCAGGSNGLGKVWARELGVSPAVFSSEWRSPMFDPAWEVLPPSGEHNTPKKCHDLRCHFCISRSESGWNSHLDDSNNKSLEVLEL